MLNAFWVHSYSGEALIIQHIIWHTPYISSTLIQREALKPFLFKCPEQQFIDHSMLNSSIMGSNVGADEIHESIAGFLRTTWNMSQTPVVFILKRISVFILKRLNGTFIDRIDILKMRPGVANVCICISGHYLFYQVDFVPPNSVALHTTWNLSKIQVVFKLKRDQWKIISVP